MTVDRDIAGDGNGTAPLENGEPGGSSVLVGESPEFVQALRRIENLIEEGPPAVLLVGEPGTGKTLLAHRVHYRAKAPEDPVLILRCSTLPPSLLERELFGAPEGFLPGQGSRKPGLLEIAGSGTVVLDEVEDLPSDLQARLAHWLEVECGTGGSCHMVAISQRDVRASAGNGRMDPGFFGLIEPHCIELPPLRRRSGDLELLARHFLRRWAEQRDQPVPHLEADAADALRAHPWPGNVRELKDAMNRAAELAPGRRVRAAHLHIQSRLNRPADGDSGHAADMILIPPEGKSWERIEEEALRATLALTGGNRSAAARILGVSRPTLRRKIRKYSLPELPAPDQS